MDQREKLIELLTKHMRKGFAVDLADELIANGFVNLSHIMLLEVTEDYGPLQIPKVILFNENKLTEDEALRIVKAGEYNDNVLCIPKSQWLSLFKDGAGC